MKETKYNFINKNKINNINYGKDLVRLDKFSIINNPDSSDIKYTGLYFPVKYGTHFAILLIDYIAGYLKLKKYYKDLKIIFFKTNNNLIYKESNSRYGKISENMADYFNAEIIDIDNNNYTFDSIFINNSELPTIPFELYDKNIILKDTPEDEYRKEVIDWRLSSFKIIHEEFNNIYNKNNTNNLFITRSLVNNRYINKNKPWHIRRIHPMVYDNTLSSIFKKNGFDIIEFENTDFFEQIKIASNAKIYIAIEGSSLINAIWCNDDIPIIIIKVNKDYKFYWKEILNACNKKNITYIDVSKMNEFDGLKYIVEQVGLEPTTTRL